MTNRGFLIAAGGTLIALALLVASRIIIYSANSQRSPVGSENLQTLRHGSSMQWSKLYINRTAASQPGTVSNISTLGIMGTNVGDRGIKLNEVYFLCGVDERKLNTQIGRGGARYKIRDIGPLPPGALFFVVSDPLGPTDDGLSLSEFLKSCATVSFVAKYNGTTEQIDFDRQTVESALPKP